MPARPLRRLVGVLVCSACLLLSQAASSTPGAESMRGEPGSGPATCNPGQQPPFGMLVFDVELIKIR